MGEKGSFLQLSRNYKLRVKVPIISIAKREEEIYVRDSSLLFLSKDESISLSEIRDEALSSLLTITAC